MKKNHSKNWIVCLGGEDWWYHSHAHFDIQMMKCLSERVPVLYVCSIGMRMPSVLRDKLFWTRVKRKLVSISHLLQQISPQLYVYSPLPLPFYQSRIGRMLNSAILRLQLRVVYLRLGIKSPLVWVNTPTAWPVMKSLPKQGLVYQRTDDYAAYDFDNFNADYIRQIDNQLLTDADMIVHVSDELHNEALKVTPHSQLVPQGVDDRFFNYTGSPPADLLAIKKPIIGYVGGTDSHKFDTTLVDQVARALPSYSFVIVGPSNPNVEELHHLPNMYFVGSKTHAEIPAYIHNFDVCMLPTAQTEWGLKCRPLKLMEYLAASKPIIATPTPASASFAKTIQIGDNAAAWVSSIENFIVEKTDTKKSTDQLRPWPKLANQLWNQLEKDNILWKNRP